MAAPPLIYDAYYQWDAIHTNITTDNMKSIITGEKHFNYDVLPQNIVNIIQEIKPNIILDYGAGLGRNLHLLQKFTNTVDYIDLITYKHNFLDNINMLGYTDVYYIKEQLPDNLCKVYDLIYASVVLQHIINDDIYEKIIEKLSNHTKFLIILQNSDVKVKTCITNYFNLIHTEYDNASFSVKHIYYIYKSNNIF